MIKLGVIALVVFMLVLHFESNDAFLTSLGNHKKSILKVRILLLVDNAISKIIATVNIVEMFSFLVDEILRTCL